MNSSDSTKKNGFSETRNLSHKCKNKNCPNEPPEHYRLKTQICQKRKKRNSTFCRQLARGRLFLVALIDCRFMDKTLCELVGRKRGLGMASFEEKPEI